MIYTGNLLSTMGQLRGRAGTIRRAHWGNLRTHWRNPWGQSRAIHGAHAAIARPQLVALTTSVDQVGASLGRSETIREGTLGQSVKTHWGKSLNTLGPWK
jgi:hypothetical protein